MDNSNGKQSFVERYMTPIAVVLGAIIIAFAFAFGHGGTQNTATNGQPTVNIDNVKTANEPFVGDPNAPVTMAFWFDYQCPFCKQFDTTVITQVYANYVKTGKVKIVFKDFQFLGNDSLAGAEYGRAIWQLYPGQFYDWYEAMFVAQDQEGDQGFGNAATIDALIKKQFPTMDVAKIDSTITQNKTQYDTAIMADRTEGSSFGIQGTPAMIIGTQLLSGAQTYDVVSGLLDAQLKTKGQ